MNTINCVVPGCTSKFETNEGLVTGARYVCSHHDRKTQFAATNREYDPVVDEKDKEIHFQGHQFDKDLTSRGSLGGAAVAKPVWTERMVNEARRAVNE